MDPDNVPSTSKRAKYLKYASDKLNACKQYPVAFDEFRKFTNVEEYVVNEMERSGPNICRINYNIRHEYFPIVYKKFYESKSVREKMMRRGLTIKPIPKFLKEQLLRMPGDDTSSSHKTKEKHDRDDVKVKFAPTKHEKSNTPAPSPAYKISSGKINKSRKGSADKDTLERHTPKAKGKSKLKPSLGRDVRNSTADEQKITNFFSALKLVKNLENVGVSTNEPEKTRKRKPGTRENSPTVKRLKDGGSKESPHADKVALAVVNRVPMGPKSRRKTIDGRMQGREKHMKTYKNNENRRKAQKSPVENFISDDSDIHSNVDLRGTQNTANRRAVSLKSSPLALDKSPLPKRNRTEDFQKPALTPRKSTPKKCSESGSENILSSSDAEIALLSLSGAVKKTTVQVSCEIQDWLSKGNPSGGESDDESGPSFLEDEFRAIDKLRAIQKYPNDVRNYIRYLLNAEIQRRRIANINPGKRGGTSKSKVVAAFREMTFDDYKLLINAEKLYAQRISENKTSQDITSGLRAQYEAIVSGKRPWCRDQHIKLSTLSDYLKSKGLNDKLDLKCIPPRLLSFEEILEHTNLKKWTSLSRSQPPGSYKQLLSLCRNTYLKCCAEGVWVDGLHFNDSNNQQEELSESMNITSPNLEGVTEPADQSAENSALSLDKNGITSDEKQVRDQLSGNVCIEETQSSTNTEPNPTANHSENNIEQMMDKMFADSQPEVIQLKETPAEPSVAEQQLHASLEAAASEGLPVSQPVMGFIPPSPALFQSSGESDERTQVVESQPVETRPPEAVFIPCNRSMTFNTEENNMTVMSADHDNHDPFASQNPEARLEGSPVQETVEDASALMEAMVKKESLSANNTQNSYNPFDDSVQIIDIPPSEPITIEDEESAPELLNLLLMRPMASNSTFVPPNSPPTQSSACMETFVHAQRMPSNLSATQSQLNPQSIEGGTKEHSIAEGVGDEEPASEVKREYEIDMEAETEHFDIDLIINTLKTDTEESREPSLSGRGALRSPPPQNDDRSEVNANSTKANDVGLNNEHSYSVQAHEYKRPPTIESICVFIPPQRISSELESTLNAVSTIYVQDSTLDESKANVIADKPEDPAASSDLEATNGRSENQIEAVVEAVPALIGTSASENVPQSHEGAAVLSASLNESPTSEPEGHEDPDLDPPMITQSGHDEHNLNPAGAVQKQQPSSEADHPSEVVVSAMLASMHLVDDVVSEKNEVTMEDLNDNLPAETMHLPGFSDADKNHEVDASNLPELVVQLEKFKNNDNNDVFIGELSGDALHHNELFVGCNLEVNTNLPQAEAPTEGCGVATQVHEEVNEGERVVAEDHHSGILLPANAKSDGESNREEIVPEEQGVQLATPVTEGNPVASIECDEVLNEVDDSKRKAEEVVLNGSLETNPCSNVGLNAMESDSNLPELGRSKADTSRQGSSTDIAAVSDNQTKSTSNSDERNPSVSLEEASALVLAPETLKDINKKTFVLPALLPIAAFKSDKIDEFLENPEHVDDAEVSDDNDDLVEVPVLINRRFIKMLPFDIVTPQQIRQTTKESTIYALRSKLEFCLQELRVPEARADNVGRNTGPVDTLKQIEDSSKQKNSTEDDPSQGNTVSMAKAAWTKPCRVAVPKKSTRLTRNSTSPSETEKNHEGPTLRSNVKQSKPTQSTNSRKKKMSPRKAAVKKPSALDFVPQKTHAFRSLALGAAKKTPASAARTKPQTNEDPPPKAEESNYNIEDVSQAIASSTASQILGTDCTYFEGSQLLQNIDACAQQASIQCPPGEQRNEPAKPKVNTFDRISLSEGLMARRIWQVNISWRTRQKMSMEVRFSFNKRTLTACNGSAHSLFNFSPTTWCDILRVLREIDHFEYKRVALKNYQAATPLHKVLRYLFESASQVANVKLTIDTHNPYAICEKVKPVYRKPFQCLTKAIAPNILSRMKAIKDGLREDLADK